MKRNEMYNKPMGITYQIGYCGNAFRVDTYKGCDFGCDYCFTKNNSYDNKRCFKLANMNFIKNNFRKAFDTNDEYDDIIVEMLRHRVPLHLGGMSDPFQKRENEHRITYKFLELTKKYNYPIIMSTKTAHLDDEYFNLLDPNIHAFQISLIGTDEDWIRSFEKNTPSPQERIEFIKELKSKGFWVSVRIQPLIDLEQANELMAQYDPGLKTVGFVDSNMVISTYEQADWLATYKTIRYALEPLIDIDSLSTYNEKYRDLNWMKYREEVKKFLQEFKLECFKRGHINHKNDNVPTNPVMIGSLDENITKLKRGIVSNIDDTQSTINGDIEQFLSSTGKINVLNGLMGLGLVEQEKTEPIFRLYTNLYLNSKDQLVQIGSKDNGLFTGAAGIGSLIYNWFDKKIGEQIINNIDATKIHDMSLKSGLAGIGLAKLALYQANKQEEQKVEVQKIASIVTSHYKACQTLGILDGKLGLLLFLEKVGIYFNDSNLIKIVKQEINNFVAVHLSFNDGVYLAGTALGRESYFPYLNSGTAGLALVLLEFMYDEIVSNEIRPLINKLIETLDVNLTYMNGLFDGFGGLMLVDLAAKNYGYPNYLAKKIDLINNYLDIEEDQILVPGPYGLKNSMDLASGAIGMLTVFQGIKENNWGKWIPLVHSTNFSLFEGGE